MKSKLLSILLLLWITVVHAQVKSPEQFLGYKVGEKVTPQWKVLSYFQYLSTQFPDQMKLEPYGTTNEGRTLALAFVSSKENIKNLEQIRIQNLQKAGVLSASEMKVKQPVILWMSHNVHGNEISSAEASMLTVYALLSAKSADIQQNLEKTLVIMDPCLNPDGTDRYANWYNGVVGKNANVIDFAREHNEPWPRGRVNHYYFDLNRDWAWQTQVESRLRLQKYNAWLPQVHVDFHEQGYNEPYYFPPAAEPLHDVISGWQKDFQKEMGKFNAQYFDSKGWLYFTNERFDLFYPSYGDTYPMYSGAIGMTFEQGGNGDAGLGIITDELDTLTLVQRAEHHHASAMNVFEIVSKNAEKLQSEFEKYYLQARNGGLSSYAAYVIKYQKEDESKLNALLKLMEMNQIQCYSGSGTASGMDYGSKKSASYTLKSQDIVIPGNQPKAALIRVLFEPESNLHDSVTYDITAWALPYVYGLEAIASKNKLATATAYKPISYQNQLGDSFAYTFKWNGFASAQLLAQLLKEKFQVKVSEKPFTINKEVFPSGSITVVNKGANAGKLKTRLQTLADSLSVQVMAMPTGMMEKGSDLGSPDVNKVKPARIVLLSGEQTTALKVGEVWHYMDAQLNYPVTLVNTEDIKNIDWSKTDVLVLPNGKYSFFKTDTLQIQLENWVKQGGKIIAMENAIDEMLPLKWTNLRKLDSVKKEKPKLDLNALPTYGDRERAEMKETTSGAIYKLKFDATHPLMFGINTYYTLKLASNQYQFLEKGKGWNVAYLTENARMSGFVGEKLNKKLQNTLVFASEDIGKGKIIYLRDPLLFRNFWENGKLVFANALFF